MQKIQLDQLDPNDLPDEFYIDFGKRFVKERWSDIKPQIIEMKKEIDVSKVRAAQCAVNNKRISLQQT